MFSTWFRYRPSRKSACPRRFRLAVEALEDRVVPSTFSVTNTNDSGSGSLRQAILNANSTPGADTISFSIGSGAATIVPASVLPSITDTVTIDGTSQPGYAGSPLVDLLGSASAQAGYDGLTITAPSCVVRGLAIGRFTFGITIQGSAATGNLVAGDYLGTDVTGLVAAPNAQSGLKIDGAASNTIGGTTPADRDVISGNKNTGVYIINGSSANLVLGDYIGVNANGSAALPNQNYFGVHIRFGSFNNIVGGTAAGAGNVISGNADSGVRLEDSGTSGNKVQGNLIGLDSSGTTAIGNGDDGVDIFGAATNNTVTGNVLSGNAYEGVWISDAGTRGNAVQGNTIGLNQAGTAAIPNGDSGVYIQGGATSNTVGAGNVISGNSYDGVYIDGQATSHNVIQGNFIGTNAAATVALPNGTAGTPASVAGVEIHNAASNTVGGTAAGAGNVIAGNAGNGILIDASSSLNVVQGNQVGTNAAGTAGLGNGVDGIQIQQSFDNTIGGTTTGAGNVISGNAADGVLVTGHTAITFKPGTNDSGGLKLTSAGTAAGFTLSTFADGFPANGSVGPLGIGFPAAGGVLVSDDLGYVRHFNTDTDNQKAPSNTNAVYYGGGGKSDDISKVGATLYMANATHIIQLNADGSAGPTLATSPVNAASLVTNPVNGHLFYSTLGSGKIYQVDPSATNPTPKLFASGVQDPDGLTITSDGSTLYVASKYSDPTLNHIIAFDVATGQQTSFDSGPIKGVDGVALGAGDLSGYLFANTNYGTVVEVNLADPTNQVVIASGGSRGDFVKVDPTNGTLLLTQTDRVERLTPPPGSGFDVGSGTYGNVIQGNTIGTYLDGTAALANGGDGIHLVGVVTSSVIGPGNLLSGNTLNGVEVSGVSAVGNVIAGNLIGTTASGLAALGNGQRGVFIDGGVKNTVGGTTAAARNVIAANGTSGAFEGVLIANNGAHGNVVEGNYVGLGGDGSTPLPNSARGIGLGSAANNNVIGGTAGGAGNLIGANGAANAGGFLDSVAVDNWTGNGYSGVPGVGNAIRGNSIVDSSAGGNGIYLATGANHNQAAPVLGVAYTSESNSLVSGSLASTANTTFALEFFASAAGSPPEGQTLLGQVTVTTNASGQASFSVPLAVGLTASQFMTATATKLATGDTSAFSTAVAVQVGAPDNVQFGLDPTSLNEAQSVTLSSGSFTESDPLVSHSVSIDWGDGSTPDTVDLAVGVTAFGPFDHTYLDGGSYSVTATVSASLGSSSSSSTPVGVANVPPSDLNLSLEGNPVPEMQQATLDGSFSDPGVLDPHTVTIDWGDGTAVTTLNLPAGQLSFSAAHPYDSSLTGTPAGPTPIGVTVSDDDGGSVTGATSVTVQQLTPTVQVTDAGGVEDGNPFPGDATVTGASGVPDSSLDSVSPTLTYFDGNGVQLSGAPASPGHYTVVATFPGSPDYTDASASTTFIIKAQASVALGVSGTQTYGQKLTFTAVVTSDIGAPPAGEVVNFLEGDTQLGSGTLDASGQATFTTAATQLAAGNHTITASYAGNTDFEGSRTDLPLTVQKADQTISFGPLSSTTYGTAVSLQATASSGLQVTFFRIVSGPASLSGTTVTPTGAGTVVIEASQPGNSNYNPATPVDASLTVGKALLTIKADDQEMVHGSKVPALTSHPSGFVNGDGPSVLRGAPAITTVPPTSDTGSYPITISQGTLDADNYSFLFQNGILTIDKAFTNISLKASAGLIHWGQSVTLTAQVNVVSPGTGTPTGQVQFEDNGVAVDHETLDGSGDVTWTTSTLAIGPHTLTAVDVGDTNFRGSSSPGMALGVGLGDTAIDLSVSAASNPTVFGQLVTLQASVSASIAGLGTPTGKVLFEDAGIPLGSGVTLDSNGEAVFPTSTLPVGPHLFTAVYQGDTNFSGNSSASAAQGVAPDSAVTTLPSSAGNTSVFGQAVKLTATVTASAPGSGTPTGTVTFQEGTTELGTVPLDGNGVATLNLSTLAVGTHTITAVYSSGDDHFTASTPAPTLTQTVMPDPSVVRLSPSPVQAVYGQAVTLTATVSAGAPGSGIPGGTVTFMAGTKVLGTATLHSGVATLKTSSLALGKDTVTAVYGGDADFLASPAARLVNVKQDHSTTRLSASMTHATFHKPVILTANVLAMAPGAGMPTGTVTFKEGAKVLGKARLVKGVATLKLTTLTRGKHTITAIYSSDPDFLASTSALVTVTVT